MAVSSFARWALASLLAVPLVQGLATEIVVDGTYYSVNSSTLAPAGALVNGKVQLTDAIVTNLTDIGLSNAELFEFDTSSSDLSKRTYSCKVYPGDAAWPATLIWDIFDILAGGALISTVPLAAPCYADWPHHENTAQCLHITDDWTNSSIHASDPTSIMWPLYQGRTCMPTNDTSASCTLGAYPVYALNVSHVAQIQLAVNFARNANLRLVVKNTGHDFNGKSSGAGALSIWTHNLKDLEYIPNYSTSYYTGKAVKMGAGIQAFEIYEFARANGVTAVGGEGRTVGVAGGYVAGGGHSPLSSIYGMAADQVLEMEVVTPDGRFVTASAMKNTDLYWALRGGGGSTFGVVTSVTSKVYPVLSSTVMKFSFEVGGNITADMFWAGVRTYFDHFVEHAEKGIYSYFAILTTGTNAWSFGMQPLFAPNYTAAELETLVAPWFAELGKLGISITPSITEYTEFYDAWWDNFPLETVGTVNIKTGSRLFPKANFQNETITDTTFYAIKESILAGGSFLAFNIQAADNAGNDNSVNPAWRDTCLHAIMANFWAADADNAAIALASEVLTYNWIQLWRNVSPDGGAYMSEADIMEPNFQQAFYGTNYDRLYSLKQKYDPKGLFYAPTAVGSEDWYIADQLTGLPTQNGRLCPATW
ncbi:uncharacterized protein EAF02_007931 [Botrytis sinoallii]|uniref:uncharacterized protein n=1 Tax=Botrytis sinoallii TaxID=1463999 RepID=UPI0018FF7B96|nr:uncharacterized protein EAF02_007931 [Botrytis sinoallii]KAF7879761.1 hypothetical protein EAF02_007931 [Botrytis sinoallii]